MKQFLRPKRAGQTGVTLIELMIAMVLGLLLILGLSNVFLAQRQSYRVNENLARMQDNARIAFELMARELREAGGNACGTTRVGNVVNGAGGSHWLDWSRGGVQGYEGNVVMPGVVTGNGIGQRVAGTDAVTIRTASLNTALIITQHDVTAAQLMVSPSSHEIKPNEILMACDYRQAAIFQVVANSSGSSSGTINHNSGTGTPGNCSKGLGFPTDCSSTNGNPYSFENHGFLSRLTVTNWYIGNNARGGRSLFRIENGGAAQEVAEGVTDLQLEYLTRVGTSPASSYANATLIGSWANDAVSPVIAVRIAMDLESLEAVGTDAANPNTVLRRQLIHVVSLRHREALQ